jgi:hypothetical protein
MKRQKIATNFAAKEYISLKLINKRRKPLQYFRKSTGYIFKNVNLVYKESYSDLENHIC